MWNTSGVMTPVNTSANLYQAITDTVGTDRGTLVHDSLSIKVDNEVITFSGREVVRLKEMLTKYIETNHPEDLL